MKKFMRKKQPLLCSEQTVQGKPCPIYAGPSGMCVIHVERLEESREKTLLQETLQKDSPSN